MLLGAGIEEKFLRGALSQLCGADFSHGGDRILKADAAMIALLNTVLIYADAVLPEIIPQKFSRKNRTMRKGITFRGEGRESSHGEGEGFVLLDQIQERFAAKFRAGAVANVRSPPGACNEGIAGTDFQGNASVVRIGELHVRKQIF